ncbi:MAG: 16S rRNA (adenine(1518)-N(6)/adenine(1519)-N(6))-dimethyltransferase RsmA [Pseudothermotoga sp.]|nr:16S rRNA (adenine(1518)-N(6)/adenine(1519)-N(6))-dimethyltransferase RsmA [Pseudothermotoga sp.]
MRRYGQHFLVCEWVGQELSKLLDPSREDTIVEIGCGKGFLTSFTAKLGCRLLCYEIDETLVEEFKRNVSGNVELRLKDFLKVSQNEIEGAQLCYGSIPYQISSKIIRKVIELGFKRCIFIVQKEFAEKLAHGRDKRRLTFITALTQTYFDVRVLFHVPRTCFDPPPKVDSTMVELVRKRTPLDLKRYEEFLRRLFSRPNKTLKNALKTLSIDYQGPFENVRVFNANVDQIVKIYLEWCYDEGGTFRNGPQLHS